MISREDFIAKVLSFVGTPVVHMGRKPGKALDCVGVPWAACWALGLELPNTPAYGYMPGESDLTIGLSMYCDPTDRIEDSHIWQVKHGRQARHCVVPVGQNEIGQVLVVQAWARGRVVRQTMLTDAPDCMWRIRGVE